MIISGDVVKYKGTLITFSMIIEKKDIKTISQNVRKNSLHIIIGAVVIILYVSLKTTEVLNFENEKGVHELVHVDKRVIVTC